MITPKVLVLGTFTPKDLQITVGPSNRRIDQKIEAQLEEVWQANLEKARKEGRVIYNGISYRLNAFKQETGKIMLEFGTFEYKVRDGLINIPGYFDLPEAYYRKGCYTGATVKTADDRYLMVELSGKSMNMNSIDTLGGIMDAEPEIKTGEGVFKSLYKELGEEALITEQDIARCYLRALFLEYKTNVCFYFEVVLSVTSEEILHRLRTGTLDQEIKLVKVLTKEDYLLALRHHNANKQLIAELLAL